MSSMFSMSLSDVTAYARNTALSASTLVMGSELEKKLQEACSNEPWGASGTMLAELSKATFSYDDFQTIMAFVWRNLQHTGSLWRVVYKALNLLEHLVRNGSGRVIEDARDHLSELKKLKDFNYTDPDGKDCGANVKERARLILELLNDDAHLTEEREKAKAARDRYKGVSAQDMGVENAGTGASVKEPAAAASRGADAKGFSDEDFKWNVDRNNNATTASSSGGSSWLYGASGAAGLTSYFGSALSTVSDYAEAANKQLASMATAAPAAHVSAMLGEALSAEPSMPSSGTLYELGRATEQSSDSYRVITSAVWQALLRSNQKPIVLLKALRVLEAVLQHGSSKALDEAIDMRGDINALATFAHSDAEAAARVQAKATSIIALLDDSSKLDELRDESRRSNGPQMGTKGGDGGGEPFSIKESSNIASSRTASAASSCTSIDSTSFAASFGNADDGIFGTGPPGPQMPTPPPAPAVDDLLGSFDDAPSAPPPPPAPATVQSPPNLFDPSEPAAAAAPTPPAVAGLTGAIGKISVNIPTRDGVSRRREAPAGGGLTLGALPKPATAGTTSAAAPAFGAVAAPPPPTKPPSAADDLLGLMDLSDPVTASSAPAVPLSVGAGNLFDVAPLESPAGAGVNVFEAGSANLFETAAPPPPAASTMLAPSLI